MAASSSRRFRRELNSFNSGAPKVLRSCQTCRSVSKPKYLLCGRCKNTYYCGVECQKKDWSIHKLACNPDTMLKRDKFSGIYTQQEFVAQIHRVVVFNWLAACCPKKILFSIQCISPNVIKSDFGVWDEETMGKYDAAFCAEIENNFKQPPEVISIPVCLVDHQTQARRLLFITHRSIFTALVRFAGTSSIESSHITAFLMHLKTSFVKDTLNK